jgi:hypothetical protein
MRRLGFLGCLLLGVSLALPLQGAAAAQSGKLVVIVMENETYDDIAGNSQAPYLNQLIAQGELFTDYAAVASGSNPNYLGMTSGLTTAPSPPSLPPPNVFQAIDASGGAVTWKEFMESMPGNCASGTRTMVPGTSVPQYTSDHDPDYKYRADPNSTCSTNDVPMTASTFNPASLPSLSYVVPNECDDMHTLPTGGQACPAYFGPNPGTSLINMGDNWLATVVPQLLAQPNVTVLITWDEGRGTTTPPQHVVAVEAGAGVTPGSRDGTAYTHYGLEAGLYRHFGLGCAPNGGAGATALPFPSPAGAPPAVCSFTPATGPAGTPVTISGSAFTGATAVRFNGTPATFTVKTDGQIIATVPAGATNGPIAVDTSAGTGTSLGSFAVTTGTPPAAPTNLTASPSAATVSLSWTDSDPAVTYRLDRSNDPGFGTYTSVPLPAGTASYRDTGLASAVYYYRLAAINSGGQSPYASASAATLSYTALVAGRSALAAYWRLGEGSGASAGDAAGTYSGTYVNGPALGSPGAIANDPDTSVTFNGTNQRVTLPSLPAAGDFSIEGWTYLTNGSVTNNTLYGGNGTVRLLARPGTGPTEAYAGVTLNGTEYVLQPLSSVSNLNTWVYWVLTRQGGTMTLYRDGVQIAQRSDLPAAAPATINGDIASQTNNLYYLNGKADDVAVYNRALSSAEVSNGYVAAVNGTSPNSQSGPGSSYYSVVTADPGLLAYWRLGEGSGASAGDAAGTYSGTYVNGPALGSPGAIANDPDTSVTFNGTNQRVTLPSLPAAGDFSIEGWTYLTNGSVTNNTLYGGNGTVRLLARPGTGPTEAYAGVTLNGTEYVLQPLSSVSNLNTWVYWVLTRQGGTMTLYRDGVQIAQRSDLPAAAPATINGDIASQTNNLYYLNGKADDVAVYASALTPDTIASHYQAALTGPAPS